MCAASSQRIEVNEHLPNLLSTETGIHGEPTREETAQLRRVALGEQEVGEREREREGGSNHKTH